MNVDYPGALAVRTVLSPVWGLKHQSGVVQDVLLGRQNSAKPGLGIETARQEQSTRPRQLVRTVLSPVWGLKHQPQCIHICYEKVRTVLSPVWGLKLRPEKGIDPTVHLSQNSAKPGLGIETFHFLAWRCLWRGVRTVLSPVWGLKLLQNYARMPGAWVSEQC